MSARRELAAFALVLGSLVACFLHESLFLGKVLSPADVLFVAASFHDIKGADYEPANRLLTDPVLQFQPWIEFNRAMLRRGRLPLWNDLVGCGAPHLANSQSGVFDPFHLIAYAGTLPDDHAWIAAARLWVAGLGMFLLARSWGYGCYGRWFAGLAFPISGFLVVWLLYPVTSVAVWFPWVFWATDRAIDRPGMRPLGVLALVVGCLFLGGHVQTSAHVLLASGSYAVWRAWSERKALAAWTIGVGLGLALAAISIVPLLIYLNKSPVWQDRELERPSPWALTRPRVLDTLCTAVPYAFGSQRRGQPNLAKAVGVHNLNESAGGFAGLATLIWLAPQGWRTRKTRDRAVFLAGLTTFGFLGAFGFPPIVNLLRAIPLVNVTDHRRLTLWVSFGLILLGGAGLDHLSLPWPTRISRWWVSLWVATAAALCFGSLATPRLEPWLRARAEGHYARAAASTPGADADVYRHRADRQVRQVLDHLPRQLLLTSAELAVLTALAMLAGNGVVSWSLVRPALFGLTIVELFGFGFGLNPAIARGDDRAVPDVIARLQDEVGRSGRVLGLGEELPPNVAMRYGLADARNYDSVELSRSVDWFEPLYEPGPAARSSRRTITWSGVLRARDQLREAGVNAIVAATAPPATLATCATRIGPVWLVRLAAEPLVSAEGGVIGCAEFDHGRVNVKIRCSQETYVKIRQTYDSGWRADVDGRRTEVEPHRGAFLSVRVGKGEHTVSLVYDPPEVRVAAVISWTAAGVLVFALTGFRRFRSTRFLGQGLGPFQAVGLESDCDLHRKSWPAYH